MESRISIDKKVSSTQLLEINRYRYAKLNLYTMYYVRMYMYMKMLERINNPKIWYLNINTIYGI